MLVHRCARDARFLREQVHAESVRRPLAHRGARPRRGSAPVSLSRAPGASGSVGLPSHARASRSCVVEDRLRQMRGIIAPAPSRHGNRRPVWAFCLGSSPRRQTSTAAARSGARRRDRGLELPLEHLLEQVAAAAHTPELELGVVAGVEPEHDEVGADLARRHSSTMPRRPRSRPSARRRIAASLRRRSRALLSSAADARLRRLDLAAPVMTHERGEELDLVGREAAEFARDR